MPKKILVAPDSFKGSLSAKHFCKIAEQVAQSMPKTIEVISRPMSDGGEGFVDAVVYSGLAESRDVYAQDPLGRALMAKFAWQRQSKTAIVEMAQASGLPLLKDSEKNPMAASTYGTGQLIQAAIDMGAKTIVLGLGGSATNDGGLGALHALGLPFLGEEGEPISLGGQGLMDIVSMTNDPSQLQKLRQINWVIATDVNNPLLGTEGATQVFGPQKGVNETNQHALEAGLEKMAKVIEAQFEIDVRQLPGAGAAGGMAASLVAVLQAEMVAGFDFLANFLGLEKVFKDNSFDLMITGEGKIDRQTHFGKLPSEMAKLAKQYQVKTLGLCGVLELSEDALPEFDYLDSIHNHAENKNLKDDLIPLSALHLERSLKHYFEQLM